MSKSRHKLHQRIVVDAQTHQAFILVHERWFDGVAAWISVAYSLSVIAYSGWLLFDTWSGTYSSWFLRSYVDAIGHLDSAAFKLVIYTAVGGAMGAAISNIRSFVQWHAEREGFSGRYLWKHLALPFVGATLAVFVYGVIRGGTSIFGGESNAGQTITFIAWATGTLAGYGSSQVFVWLDDKVNLLLKLNKTTTVKIPNVHGKSLEEAEQMLNENKLSIVETLKEETTDRTKDNKVIWQDPPARTEILPGCQVVLALGTANESASLSGTADSVSTALQPATQNGNKSKSQDENSAEEEVIRESQTNPTTGTDTPAGFIVGVGTGSSHKIRRTIEVN